MSHVSPAFWIRTRPHDMRGACAPQSCPAWPSSQQATQQVHGQECMGKSSLLHAHMPGEALS